MRLPNKSILLITALLSTTALATETPCDFQSKDKLIYEGRIESVRVVKKVIQPMPSCEMNASSALADLKVTCDIQGAAGAGAGAGAGASTG